MLDFDDGFSEEMIERHLLEMRKNINLQTPDEAFNSRYGKYLVNNSEIADRNSEHKTLLSDE